MKKNYEKKRSILTSKLLVLCLILSAVVFQPLSAQITYTFSTCGATGQFGPNQGQVNATYAGANPLNGQVTVSGQGIQLWPVPGGGQYKIQVVGASGGPASSYPLNFGRGASMEGIFTIAAGTVLKIIVGQQGQLGGAGGSGGGGSWVVDNTNTPLIVAGGGSGGGNYANPIAGIMDGRITNYGAAYQSTGRATAGGGGGSFSTSGLNVNGGQSFMAGGTGGGLGGTNGGYGGFGGGAGSSGSNALAAGGGGYSGGDEMYGYQVYQAQEGGGGSYNGGTNQVNVAGVNLGDGKVIITRLCNVDLQSSKNPICLGESLSLTTNAVSNVVWSHTPSTATLVNISPTSNTSYTLIGQAASGCTTSAVITVTVNPLPVLSAVVIPSVLCIGNAATVIPSGGVNYTWTASSLVALTTTVNPIVTSSFNYSGENIYGCTSSTQVAVTVNTNSLGITPNSAVCAGNSIVLTANNAVTYTWSTGSNFQSTPVSPVTNTTYMASGTDIHNCVISNQVNVTVDQKPNVTASAGKSTICKGESTTLNASGANTYTWSGSLGSGAQVTINPPVDVAYSYTVTGTSSNGCENTAVVAVTVSKCTGLGKMNGQEYKSRIYPNPTSGEVTVELNNGLINSVEVTDLTGRVIMNVDTQEESVSLDLNKLSNGVYYFKVKSTEHVEIIKVVKSN